jgi:hypothetical protein
VPVVGSNVSGVLGSVAVRAAWHWASVGRRMRASSTLPSSSTTGARGSRSMFD